MADTSNHESNRGTLRDELRAAKSQVRDLEALAVRLEATAEQLRASEARFRTICEHAPVMIDSFDEDGRVTIWNRQCERNLGYTFEEMRRYTEPLALAYPDADDQRRVREAIARADGTFREYQVRAKDGSVHTQLWANFRLPTGAVISVGHDTTERRQLEEQLRQSQKMEALGQLTGGIAHDFNNLLTVVMANAELLALDLTLPPPRAEKALQEIRAASDRGARLIRKLMAFSRQHRMALGPVDLVAIVDDLVPSLEHLLPEHIRITWNAPEGIPHVVADPGSVEQILVNLVTNSRDAMPAGGILELGLATTADHRVALTVRDDGVGMDAQLRERIFDPFFTTKPEGQGTGLGLAMVYGLAKKQDAVLSVESTTGVGTAVTVAFAVAGEAPAPLADDPGADTRHRGTETVLVVEDREGVRDATRRVLEHHGYHTLQAADGEEALDVLRRRGDDVHLVLTDVVMPRMSGPELQRAALGLGRDTLPFVFTTGYFAPEKLARPVEPDGVVLQKPWSATQLLAAVRAALDDAQDG